MRPERPALSRAVSGRRNSRNRLIRDRSRLADLPVLRLGPRRPASPGRLLRRGLHLSCTRTSSRPDSCRTGGRAGAGAGGVVYVETPKLDCHPGSLRDRPSEPEPAVVAKRGGIVCVRDREEARYDSHQGRGATQMRLARYYIHPAGIVLLSF